TTLANPRAGRRGHRPGGDPRNGPGSARARRGSPRYTGSEDGRRVPGGPGLEGPSRATRPAVSEAATPGTPARRRGGIAPRNQQLRSRPTPKRWRYPGFGDNSDSAYRRPRSGAFGPLRPQRLSEI